jgi:signal transduction histidine kinase
VVDAMTPFDGDLGAMLGSLRPRLERRLTLANITLEWAVEELPAAKRLTPIQVQHLERLLLEAVTNIAKHSNASVAVLSAGSVDGVVELGIRDNGRGFEPDAAHSGNGLRNMHWRAATLGGTLSITSGGGSSLVLALPV